MPNAKKVAKNLVKAAGSDRKGAKFTPRKSGVKRVAKKVAARKRSY